MATKARMQKRCRYFSILRRDDIQGCTKCPDCLKFFLSESIRRDKVGFIGSDSRLNLINGVFPTGIIGF